jgi:putative FmdB family regulatory protein
MPIYEYEREDGSTFEIMQKISEDALEKCPTTGQSVKRLISQVVSHFKGNGFYQTDYNGGNASAGTKGGASSKTEKSESSTTSKDTTKKADSLKTAKPKGCGTTCGC